jgi:hypothetical protein
MINAPPPHGAACIIGGLLGTQLHFLFNLMPVMHWIPFSNCLFISSRRNFLRSYFTDEAFGPAESVKI